MKNLLLRFPGGKNRAVTLSYDDGVEQDIRLIQIMKEHGLKGTFNLNSGRYRPENEVSDPQHFHRTLSRSEAQRLYHDSGMEIAVHSVNHPWLDDLPPNICAWEVLQDRINLERDFGCIVQGMAYPYGRYNDQVIETLRQCGIVYARTVQSTERFDIPKDWLRLPATCHHNHPELMRLAGDFLKNEEMNKAKLFYLWGHSYEFELNNNWNVIEDFADYVGNREDVWYATNMEVYSYVTAFDQLVFSTEGNMVYNPTCQCLYFRILHQDYCVQPGEVCSIRD